MAHTFMDSPSLESRSISHSHSRHSANPPTYSSEAPSEAPSESTSDFPEIPNFASESGQDPFGESSSFKDAISDILRGSLFGNSMPMPTQPHHISESRQSTLGLDQICMHTDYPDVCMTTIKPLVSQNFDIMDVLAAAIKVCSIEVKLTTTKVKRHAAKNPAVASAVSECQEQYKIAAENLHRAMKAVESRDLGTITVMLSAVMADVSTCESAFEDIRKSPSSDMTKTDGLVTITVSNSLSIANLVPY
ncbi:pectinesterase/pectinesterase inhibitor 3 [Trifolium pratense]|uniref:Pectinesterase/pectinesterase inhibitor 3 n=1 Tax=Trifolium pratense TaxID=57577 RepID=A0A2K3L131_TRIPR|nr:pectinesterase/pectinesterase inhibitor 3 [Trifolium pratense]